MPQPPSHAVPKRILIVQPSWIGDAVMATPTLRAVRRLYPDAHISYLMKRYVKPVYAGLAYADRLITYRTGRTPKKAGKQRFFGLAARLRRRKFDMAILLPNSFKAALVCKMAGIERIVGYDRDGRGFLLTDKLLPTRAGGKFVPAPIVKYYLGLAGYLGSTQRDLTLELVATASDRREAGAVFTRAGLDPALDRPASKGGRPLVLLNPGAQYGAAKCWPAKYFAELADKMVAERGATVLVSSSPRERRIVDEIFTAMRHPAVDLAKAGLTLGALKDVVRRCDLMITNDTGPRHIAAAFGTPLVTLFGPTHQEWTEIYFDAERKLQEPVFCGPCQKKTCPLDHRCMIRILPDRVATTASQLLSLTPARALRSTD